MKVAELLARKGRSVVTAKASATLTEIAALLAEKKIGAVLIMSEPGKIEGIISERDIILHLADRGAGILSDPVYDHMTRDVITCSEESSIDEIRDIMTTRRIRHLPVMEGGDLVGIISINDVVMSIFQGFSQDRTTMRDYLAGT